MDLSVRPRIHWHPSQTLILLVTLRIWSKLAHDTKIVLVTVPIKLVNDMRVGFKSCSLSSKTNLARTSLKQAQLKQTQARV